jgi:hypothetical protein
VFYTTVIAVTQNNQRVITLNISKSTKFPQTSCVKIFEQ